MKKVLHVLLFLFVSMFVFAVDFSFGLGHQLAYKSGKYGIVLQFYTGTSSTSSLSMASSKTLMETTDSQYVGQIVGVINNGTNQVQNVYYNIYWMPFYLVKADFSLDKNNSISYALTMNPTADAGSVDISELSSSGMPDTKLGNESRKISIAKNKKSTSLALFNVSIQLENTDVIIPGDYTADLVLEVLGQ